MRETFRLSMAYLHTWLGLVLGFVLMVVFFFGSLTVFDREIDRWSVPETRSHAAAMPSFDRFIRPLAERVRPDPDSLASARDHVFGPLPAADSLEASDWWIATGHRDPMLRVYVSYNLPNKPRDPGVDHEHVSGEALLDPRTGEPVRADVADRLRIGSGFFYPMHYMLHIEWRRLGIWIVGLAGLAMLAALVSGVVMHRRIFREFFTFRPDKAKLRGTLDLHNMTGVLALPFLFVITLSGLIIMAYIYLPAGALMKPLVEARERVQVVSTPLPEHPAGRPGQLASVDAMMAHAKARWAARGMPGEIGIVEVRHVGDADAYVAISRDNVDRVATTETVYFHGGTGRVLYESLPTSAVATVYGFVTGLHYQQFKHWGLRWLLFMGGLMGCACIATGFLFFVEKRKKRHAAAGVGGARWVDALAVTTVTGMLVATAAMLLANRLLPVELPHQGAWQQAVFWLTWLATLAHALWRSAPVARGGASPAWGEQAAVAAGLAVAAVLANWITTGDHLLKTLGDGYWPVAGVDLVLLAGAGGAAWTAMRLRERRSTAGHAPPTASVREAAVHV